MDFDPKVQLHKDGPFTPEVRQRINSFRPDSTLADIGRVLGFSGAFISQLLSTRNPGRVRSLHVPRIMAALEKAEAERAAEQPAQPQRLKGPLDSGLEGLREHIRAIEALGFNVTLTPKQK